MHPRKIDWESRRVGVRYAWLLREEGRGGEGDLCCCRCCCRRCNRGGLETLEGVVADVVESPEMVTSVVFQSSGSVSSSEYRLRLLLCSCCSSLDGVEAGDDDKDDDCGCPRRCAINSWGALTFTAAAKCWAANKGWVGVLARVLVGALRDRVVLLCRWLFVIIVVILLLLL